MMQATDLRLTFNPGTPVKTQRLREVRSLNISDGEFVTVIDLLMERVNLPF